MVAKVAKEMQMVSTRREGGQQVDEVSEEPSDGSSETMRAKRTDEVGVDAHFMIYVDAGLGVRKTKEHPACE